jgi:hypothetical protein
MSLGKPMISNRLPKAFSQPKHLNQKKFQEHHQELSAVNEFKNVKKLLSPLKQQSSKNSALSRALNKLSFFPSISLNTPSHNLQIDLLLQTDLKLNEMLTLSILKASCRSGIVKKSLHAPSLKLYASKEVPVSTFTTRQKLLDSIRAWQGIQSQARYLVEIYSSFWNTPEGCVTIVQEYMAKDSLARLCEIIGAVPEKVLKSISRRVLSALGLHHRKIGPHGGVDLHHVMFTRYGKAKLGLALTGKLGLRDDNNGKKNSSLNEDVFDFGVTLLAAALGSAEWAQECLSLEGDCCVVHSALKNKEIPYIQAFSAKFLGFLCSATRFKEEERASVNNLIKDEWLKSDECVGAEVCVQDLLCLRVISAGKENVFNVERHLAMVLESLHVVLSVANFNPDQEAVKELASEFGVTAESLQERLDLLKKND